VKDEKRMDKLLLTLITFVPLLGAVVMLLVPGNQPRLIRSIAVVTTGVVFALTLGLWAGFDPQSVVAGAAGVGGEVYKGYDAKTLVEVSWIAPYHIYYRLGVDGLSVLLIVMTGLVSFLATFTAFSIQKQVKSFYVLYMLLITGMMGVFMALDFFLFYVFWEVMLLPMYFLIGIWGGPRKEYAAIKFFYLYAARLSLIMIVMLAYYFKMQTFEGASTPTSRSTSAAGGPASVPCAGWADPVPAPDVLGSVHRVRHQGADLPVPHLVARRARRGAHGHLGDSGGRAAEDGWVRYSAF
jgi:NADH-quinone oxidoreductase subunit M